MVLAKSGDLWLGMNESAPKPSGEPVVGSGENDLSRKIGAELTMDSGKIVAIVTGAISIILAVAYLVLVQILDFRGEMVPAPMETMGLLTHVAAIANGPLLP
ncbi:hypothetical protein [Synechocystis sp. LEGE 06083]|uniref:hypothetical protein n=2 Tax=unclassified Synechocystis TaxID=2640012 RepID=UPI001D1556C6|nr:hypothetical protein [Synechocystis sp. LEGE 06083]